MAAPQDFDIPGQIVEQARLIRSSENTEMVIRLKPEHLGELTLKVSVSENGAVTASFHSDNAQVRAIIENSLVQLRQELMRKVLAHDGVLQVHGFYADMEARTVSFDLILDFDLEDRRRTYTEICQEVQQAWPDFRFIINLDIDA